MTSEMAHEWGISNNDPNSIWKFNTQGMIFLLEALGYLILRHLHEETHCGRDATMDLIRPHLKSPHLQRITQQIIQACQMCAQNNLPKAILKQDVLQQEREYHIKGYACVRTSNLTLHRCLKPKETLNFC